MKVPLKSAQIGIRATETERKLLERAASRQGLRLSQYILNRSLKAAKRDSR